MRVQVDVRAHDAVMGVTILPQQEMTHFVRDDVPSGMDNNVGAPCAAAMRSQKM